MSWLAAGLLAFDLETTGTDIENDRIVTAALVRLEPDGTVSREQHWLVDPGIPIPAQATAIHGIGTAQARERGVAAAGAVEEITRAIAEGLGSGTPLVIMNARYDLSLLDRECRRHGVSPLSARLGGTPAPVIDPLVLDKHADRYRRGKRNLQALCEHYGVVLDGAHQAGADAVAAARVARRLGEVFPAVGGVALADLHALQVRAAAEQAASFQQYLRRTSDPQARIEPAWPVVPWPAAAAAG
ncbi:exonuclease domain-containing protein [Kitasatospora sp. DSM 101779]|uniref:exonuclease domain-containing protein n=1 Tax=Kitasatospora sp. DSM 101779 TaxID=2853165 RepID=UPI0021D9DEC8|nr:exonuclease domain-containing protein [Kitasatospora sp. DSM 101779]MCU7825405.1 3'-5' exonuclease [Kitasatospora sp. DSM 101779]